MSTCSLLHKTDQAGFLLTRFYNDTDLIGPLKWASFDTRWKPGREDHCLGCMNFPTNQNLLQANSPRTMTSPNARLQVSSRRKFIDNMSVHTSSYWLLPPRHDRPDNKPNLGQRRSGGLKLQQSTNSSHVVILVANSNDKRLQRSRGLNLNIRPLVKVSLRRVWNPTPNSLFGWRNKLDVEKWQEATWSQTERTLIDDIFFEK